MSCKVYDFGIVGAGLAGLQLVLAFAADPYFKNHNFLLIDKDEKKTNDKIWCFWEKGKGRWDSLVQHKWAKGNFISPNEHLKLDLTPYAYKKIESLDFYQYAKAIIAQHHNIDFLIQEVEAVNCNKGLVEISYSKACERKTYPVKHCFDSRVDSEFYNKKDKYSRILQHFKGWYVQFEKPVFNPGVFTMMDFRVQHLSNTSFTYVLPTSDKTALVEFTLFDKELLTSQQYDDYLKKYIWQYVSDANYTVSHVEQGVIPMSDYPFHSANNKFITKIGTAGSWVRPSTGYSFKYTEDYVQRIINNIKSGRSPNFKLIDSRHRFYDALLLNILSERNELIPEIFEQLYKKNSIVNIFPFLSGETNLIEDIKIIASLPKLPFLRALFKHFFSS